MKKLASCVLALGVGTFGCSAPADRPAPAGAAADLKVGQPPPGSLSAETALISLVLTAKGHARIDEVRRKPVAFRAPANAAPAPGEAGFVLQVDHERLERPIRLPVALGQPGPRRAEAVAAWEGEGTILRAPSFGAGTRFQVLMVDESGDHVVTSGQVNE